MLEWTFSRPQRERERGVIYTLSMQISPFAPRENGSLLIEVFFWGGGVPLAEWGEGVWVEVFLIFYFINIISMVSQRVIKVRKVAKISHPILATILQ